MGDEESETLKSGFLSFRTSSRGMKEALKRGKFRDAKLFVLYRDDALCYYSSLADAWDRKTLEGHISLDGIYDVGLCRRKNQFYVRSVLGGRRVRFLFRVRLADKHSQQTRASAHADTLDWARKISAAALGTEAADEALSDVRNEGVPLMRRFRLMWRRLVTSKHHRRKTVVSRSSLRGQDAAQGVFDASQDDSIPHPSFYIDDADDPHRERFNSI